MLNFTNAGQRNECRAALRPGASKSPALLKACAYTDAIYSERAHWPVEDRPVPSKPTAPSKLISSRPPSPRTCGVAGQEIHPPCDLQATCIIIRSQSCSNMVKACVRNTATKPRHSCRFTPPFPPSLGPSLLSIEVGSRRSTCLHLKLKSGEAWHGAAQRGLGVGTMGWDGMGGGGGRGYGGPLVSGCSRAGGSARPIPLV